MSKVTAIVLAVLVVVGCSDPAEDPAAGQVGKAHSAEYPTGAEEYHGDAEMAQPDVFEAHLTMVDRPAEMDRADEVGASSAAEYFLFAYTYAYGTGDTDPLRLLSGPECAFCSSAVAGANEAHQGEGYMRAGDPMITGMSVSDSAEDTEDYLVWLDVQLPQMRTFDADGEVVQIHPASEIRAGLAMLHTGEQWLVRGATFEPAS